MKLNQVYNEDCLEGMRSLPDNSIDSIVTDPPYEMGFMGKSWDRTGIAYNTDLWQQALRILKPGGYLLAFGGTRTYHRMTCAIEDAGFEVRDCIQWIYGSGFPKSKNLGGGWGTALKPANEPIVVARKPLTEKTVSENVLRWGTGGLNIDGCRIEGRERTEYGLKSAKRNNANCYGNDGTSADFDSSKGRFPANIIFDETAAALLDEQSGTLKTGGDPRKTKQKSTGMYGMGLNIPDGPSFAGDSGGASRFFYCAKASKSDRGVGNTHLTVKPTKLIRYLIRLVTPVNGVCLDPFEGSGTHAVSCIYENVNYIGFENGKDSFEIATKRIQEAYTTA